jgi:hypothetical protein
MHVIALAFLTLPAMDPYPDFPPLTDAIMLPPMEVIRAQRQLQEESGRFINERLQESRTFEEMRHWDRAQDELGKLTVMTLDMVIATNQNNPDHERRASLAVLRRKYPDGYNSGLWPPPVPLWVYLPK